MDGSTDMALEELKGKVRKTLGATALVATFFLCWAVYNVAYKHLPDLGVVTFTLVVAAALFGVYLTYADTTKTVKYLPLLRKATLFSSVLLAAHYALAYLVFADSFFKRVYFGLAAVAWLVQAYYVRKVMAEFQTSLDAYTPLG